MFTYDSDFVSEAELKENQQREESTSRFEALVRGLENESLRSSRCCDFWTCLCSH